VNNRQAWFEAVSLAGTLALVLLGAWAYASLPETIATRFAFDGRVVGRGSKDALLFLPATGIVAYILLGFQAQAKTLRLDLPIAITDANRDAIYSLARDMLVAMKAVLMCGFAALEWQTIASASGHMSPWLLPVSGVFVACIIALLIAYTVRMCRQ
jgi:hypothetical protein